MQITHIRSQGKQLIINAIVERGREYLWSLGKSWARSLSNLKLHFACHTLSAHIFTFVIICICLLHRYTWYFLCRCICCRLTVKNCWIFVHFTFYILLKCSRDKRDDCCSRFSPPPPLCISLSSPVRCHEYISKSSWTARETFAFVGVKWPNWQAKGRQVTRNDILKMKWKCSGELRRLSFYAPVERFVNGSLACAPGFPDDLRECDHEKIERHTAGWTCFFTTWFPAVMWRLSFTCIHETFTNAALERQ